MVDLRAADPSLEVQTAARQAIAELRIPGVLKTHLERLRKKYPRLEARGRLPKPSTSPAESIRATFRQLRAETEQAKRELAEADREAEELGLADGLSDRSPGELAAFLEHRKEQLESSARPIQLARHDFMVGRDEEEAIARYDEAVAKIALYEKQIAVLWRIADLRARANWSPRRTT